MPFQIIRNDITKVTAEAIVNTANPRPVIGGGTDSAIYKAAGVKQLMAEREKIGEIARGDAAVTPAFGLHAKYIIHTVGPIWIDGNHNEREILRSCYRNSLQLASGLSCESIAFPLISTGTYGFPRDEALNIALEEIEKFLLAHDMEVTLVIFDMHTMQISRKLMLEIDEYIDDHWAELRGWEEYGWGSFAKSGGSRRIDHEEQLIEKENRNRPQYWEDADLDFSEPLADAHTALPKASPSAPSNAKPKSKPQSSKDTAVFSAQPMLEWSSANIEDPEKDLEKLMSVKEDTFQQRLLRLIDERNLKDPDVYKKANIDRKVFSKIRCNRNYHPKKKTAVAFAIALELDMPEMLDLLSRAGFTLSPSSKADLIISYFVTKKIFDIYEINAVLFKYQQELLGY